MTNTLFRDLLLAILATIAAMLIIMLPHINPVATGERTKDVDAPGDVMVEIFWPLYNTDVDLWVRAPGDIPVGYSNKGGAVFNLLRDDLGNRGELTPYNREIAISRGLVPGKYVVNIHLYRNPANILPIPVTAVVSVKMADGTTRTILQTVFELISEGQEVTLFRFDLDENGGLVPGSVDAVNVPLRSSYKVGE